MLEREVKIRFDSPEAARAAIAAAGATPVRSRRLQEDALLDTGDESLRRSGCAIRIRVEPGKSLLTFKGPVQPGAMKLREEHETVIGDGAALQRVFEELGFHVWFRYEKYREEYAAEEVTIALDETPVGTYVEIEGGEDGILATTAALGRSPDEFVRDSYRTLFLQQREQCGLTGPHMLFAAAV